MANTDYKPMFAGGGGGECVLAVMAKSQLPNPGVVGKLYICTDTGEFMYWDPLGQKYRPIGTPGGREYHYPTKDKFPPIGEEGAFYVEDVSGNKYIWNSKAQGHPIYQIPNFTTGPVSWDNPEPNKIFFNITQIMINMKVEIGYDGRNYKYVDINDEAGVYPLAFLVHPATGGPTPASPTKLAVTKCYYDANNPYSIDRNQIQMGYYDTSYSIFLPKTYDINYWGDDALLRLVQSGEYNYAFCTDNDVNGAYVKVS